MPVIEFLDHAGVNYKLSEHKPTFTAQHMAAEEHEPGRYVAKPVVVNVDGENVMCVLAANCKIDLKSLKSQLKAEEAELLTEEQLSKIFTDCELGAEPPFGNLYDLPTIIDKTIDEGDHIVFQAGSHEKAIHMKMEDYKKLVKPQVLEFSYHMSR